MVNIQNSEFGIQYSEINNHQSLIEILSEP